MKRFLMITAILILTGLVAFPALAQGPGWGRGRHMQGNCPMYTGGDENLTDQQRTQLNELGKKFFDETAETRNQLWSKMGELRSIMSSPNPDAEKAKVLQKEISDIKAKLSLARIDHQLQERKINPDARFGWGRGARNMGFGPGGPGRGPGSGQGGFGPGSCWQ